MPLIIGIRVFLSDTQFNQVAVPKQSVNTSKTNTIQLCYYKISLNKTSQNALILCLN